MWFYACKTTCLASEILVSIGSSPHLWFLHSKQGLLDPDNKSLWYQTSTAALCVQNSDLMTTIAWFYGSQTSPVIICMEISVPNIRITSIYGFQPLSVVFACKIASFGADFLASMGPSPYLWFLHAKPRLLDPNNKSLWVPDINCRFVHAIQRDYHQNYLSLWFPAFTTFLHAKQRLLEQNYNSPWVPYPTCRFLHLKQRE